MGAFWRLVHGAHHSTQGTLAVVRIAHSPTRRRCPLDIRDASLFDRAAAWLDEVLEYTKKGGRGGNPIFQKMAPEDRAKFRTASDEEKKAILKKAGMPDDQIDQMIEDKKALADLVVGDGESWLTELSTGDLRKVFALSEGAVGE